MHYIRSDVEPVDPSLAPLLFSEGYMTQYIAVALLTLLVYDTIITMDKEVKYFWSLPRSLVSLIYFANHYIGILGALSIIVYNVFTITGTLRLGFTWIRSLANWMTVLLIDYILLVRVLALYHQDKRLTAFLGVLFGLEAALVLGLLIYDNIYDETVVGELAKGVTLCGTNRVPSKVWDALSWVIPMVYATILMALALYKAAEHWKETAEFSQLTLVRVLIQDQAIYFIMVVFCSVLNIMANQLHIPNALLANLLDALGSPTLLCVLGSHLLVHLKEAGEREANGGTSFMMTTMSNIEFS
ncbi:hypothetical protein DFH11DRAFT_1861694 [Phellopilus nigrolimitatus]|nr:hypothetical protein DFH11DRAFT_1861694 [Phellopilus nigrolimitatus]